MKILLAVDGSTYPDRAAEYPANHLLPDRRLKIQSEIVGHSNLAAEALHWYPIYVATMFPTINFYLLCRN